MSPRRNIGMGAREIDDFLATHTDVVVVGLDAEGLASGAVGRLDLDAGAVGFALRADDPVVALLGHDDRACCVVEQFPSYYEIKGVMLHGRASAAVHGEPGEATFVLDVQRVVSYDFSKLIGS
jgi:hypothetical protein